MQKYHYYIYLALSFSARELISPFKILSTYVWDLGSGDWDNGSWFLGFRVWVLGVWSWLLGARP